MGFRDELRFDAWAGRLSGRSRQVLVLTRHFFNRFFQNDVFSFDEQMKEKLYILLAMIAPLGWFMCSALFLPFLFAPDNGESWVGKCVFLSFFMILLAVAVVLEWDVLFLDRRDELNLVPLPVRTGTLFTAKFLASFVFVGFYSAAVNSLSVVAVSMFLPGWIGGGLAALLRYMAAHVLATSAAFVFVFLFFVFVQSLLMVLLRGALFRVVSTAVRFALAVAGVVAVFLLIDPSSLQVLLKNLFENHSTGLLWLPPMWYVSIYEILIGRTTPLYEAGAAIGLAAILFLGLAFFAGMALAYRTHARRALEVRSRRRLPAAVFGILGGLFDRIFLRNPVERAVFHFTAKTLRRSAVHKIRLAGYLAVTLGFLWILLGTLKEPFKPPARASLNLLAAPSLLAFALLMGLRSGFNTPFNAEANWIFRITENKDRRPYYAALKKAVFFLALLPLAVGVWAVHAGPWGAGRAALHTLYGLSWALAARELFFWKFARIPYACQVVPGKAKLYSRWLPYLLGALFVFSGLSSLERALWRSAGGFPVFFAVLAAVLAAAGLAQRFLVYEKMELVYEEEPEPVMVTLPTI